jgi:predicted HTH transcriptional regulator
MFSNVNDLLEFINTNKNAENRVCEYKTGMSWNNSNKDFKCKIIWAILAMSNLQDGGYVIIGVEQDKENNYQPTGMTEEEALTYEYDEVLEAANSYADPYVTLTIQSFQYEGRYIIVIGISEFVEIPIICKKDYPDILEHGRLYVRPFRKPESSANLTSSELREIIELASKKYLRKHLETMSYAGMNLEQIVPEQNRSLYSKERGSF